MAGIDATVAIMRREHEAMGLTLPSSPRSSLKIQNGAPQHVVSIRKVRGEHGLRDPAGMGIH